MQNRTETTRDGAAALYHCVYAKEEFDTAAKMIFDLVKSAQTTKPDAKRILYLDIDGHRNALGGYDQDMIELQKEFLIGFLGPYLSEIYMPLMHIKNIKPQRNDLPDELIIKPADIVKEAAATVTDQKG
jgi:hypothetical protein